MAKAKQPTKKDATPIVPTDKEKDVKVEAMPPKPSLKDRITAVLTGGAVPAKMTPAQRKAHEDRARDRVELLLSRLERSTKGSVEYSTDSLKRFKWELNAIRGGTWTGPGMKMPGQGKKAEPSYYALNEQGYSDAEVKAENRVDEIITEE